MVLLKLPVKACVGAAPIPMPVALIVAKVVAPLLPPLIAKASVVPTPVVVCKVSCVPVVPVPPICSGEVNDVVALNVVKNPASGVVVPMITLLI